MITGILKENKNTSRPPSPDNPSKSLANPRHALNSKAELDGYFRRIELTCFLIHEPTAGVAWHIKSR